MKTIEVKGIAADPLSTLDEAQLWALLEAVRVMPVRKQGDRLQRARNFIAVRAALLDLPSEQCRHTPTSLEARLEAMFSGMMPTPELDGGGVA